MPQGHMPPGHEDELSPEALAERRAGFDRRQLVQLRVSRFLGVTANARPGFVDLQAMSETGDPIEIVVPIETAMTLLNALHRRSTEDGWFEVV